MRKEISLALPDCKFLIEGPISCRSFDTEDRNANCFCIAPSNSMTGNVLGSSFKIGGQGDWLIAFSCFLNQCAQNVHCVGEAWANYYFRNILWPITTFSGDFSSFKVVNCDRSNFPLTKYMGRVVSWHEQGLPITEHRATQLCDSINSVKRPQGRVTKSENKGWFNLRGF